MINVEWCGGFPSSVSSSSKYPFSLSQYGRRFPQTQYRLCLFLGVSPHLQEGSLFLLFTFFNASFFFFSPAQFYRLIPRFVCRFLSSSIVGNLVLFHPFRLCSVFVSSSASIIQCLVFWSLCDFTLVDVLLSLDLMHFALLFLRGLNVSIGTMRLPGLTLGIAGTGYLVNALTQRVLLDTL